MLDVDPAENPVLWCHIVVEEHLALPPYVDNEVLTTIGGTWASATVLCLGSPQVSHKTEGSWKWMAKASSRGTKLEPAGSEMPTSLLSEKDSLQEQQTLRRTKVIPWRTPKSVSRSAEKQFTR